MQNQYVINGTNLVSMKIFASINGEYHKYYHIVKGFPFRHYLIQIAACCQMTISPDAPGKVAPHLDVQ